MANEIIALEECWIIPAELENESGIPPQIGNHSPVAWHFQFQLFLAMSRQPHLALASSFTRGEIFGVGGRWGFYQNNGQGFPSALTIDGMV